MTDAGKMSQTDIIEQARADLGEPTISNLVEALEAFYGHGFADQRSGDVESPTGHFYRVHRWVVTTDSQGFNEVAEFDSEAEARERFSTLDDEYSEWGSDDE
jgi:hypothetical protein